MLDDIDLVEEYERIKHRECRVVEDTGQDNVLQVLQAVCVVNLSFDGVVLDSDNLLELRLICKVLPMICLVKWKVRIIYTMSVTAFCRHTITLTLQSAYDSQYHRVCYNILNDRGIVEQDKHLHDAAQAM